jgi:endoglucanase
MKTWDINAVRVPLNEACWNGESYVKKKYRGTNYRKAVEGFVNLLNRNGLVVILDLHWTDGLYTGPGIAGGTAVVAPASPTPWPACRRSSARCGPPA